MKFWALILSLGVLVGSAHAQNYVPTPVTAYTLVGGVWTPAATTTSGGVSGNIPGVPVALYCFNGSNNWGPADSNCLGGGGSSGFPITLGTTSIAASSTTTSIAGLTVNGVTLNSTGSATLFLNQAGGYTTPASGINSLTPGYIPQATTATTITTNSPLDVNITTANTVTSSEKFAAPGFIGTSTTTGPGYASFPYNTGNIAALGAGSAGFAGPSTSGGTAYLWFLPTTTSAGIPTIGSATTIANVNGAQITVTPKNGVGAGIVTGPTSSVSGDFASFTGTAGQIQDSNLTTGTSGGTIPLLNGANTYSGASIFSAAGAASTPGLSVTGASFVGTGTTSTPQLYINQSGTAPTTWTTTGGTAFGINLSGTTGNAIDIHAAGGASIWNVEGNGNVFQNGNYYMASTTSPSPYFSGVSNFIGLSSAGLFGWGSSTSGAGTRDITECREAAGVLEIGASTNCANSGTIDIGVLESGGSISVSGCSLTGATGGASVGQFASGTTGTCTVTITPGITARHGFWCRANDITTVADTLPQTATTTTTCTISGTTASGDTIIFSSQAY